MRCISLALIGPIEAAALRQNWNDWLSKETLRGSIQLALFRDIKADKFSGKGRTLENELLPVMMSFSKTENEVKIKSVKIKKVDPERFVWEGKLVGFLLPMDLFVVLLVEIKSTIDSFMPTLD